MLRRLTDLTLQSFLDDEFEHTEWQTVVLYEMAFDSTYTKF